MEEKAYLFEKWKEDKLSFTVEAHESSPMANPAFVIYNSLEKLCGNFKWQNRRKRKAVFYKNRILQ